MSDTAADSSRYARWFRASTPYISKHQGKTFVVMLGGDAVAHDNLVNIIHDLALLSVLGVRVVLVHGARPQIDAALDAAGVESRHVRHRRITDGAAIDIVRATVGTVRSAIEGWFSTGIPNTPLHKARIRVLSGNLVAAKSLGIIDGVDHEFTGRARRIDTEGIAALLATGSLVLISPLGYSPSGQMFSLSAEELAADVAATICADKLIMLDRCGRLSEEHPRSTELTPSSAETLLGAGSLDPVTHQRGDELVRAVRAGVPRAHLVSYADDGALLEELFTARGSGTQISEERFHEIRPAVLDDVAGIAELIRPLEHDGALVPRPRERLEQDIHHFLVAEIDGIIVGCCAVFPVPEEDMAQLACLATHPAYRARGEEGLGDRLLRRAEAQAGEAGIGRLYALTTQARDWFLERGFSDARVEDLPRGQGYNPERGSRVVLKRLRDD